MFAHIYVYFILIWPHFSFTTKEFNLCQTTNYKVEWNNSQWHVDISTSEKVYKYMLEIWQNVRDMAECILHAFEWMTFLKLKKIFNSPFYCSTIFEKDNFSFFEFKTLKICHYKTLKIINVMVKCLLWVLKGDCECHKFNFFNIWLFLALWQHIFCSRDVFTIKLNIYMKLFGQK